VLDVLPQDCGEVALSGDQEVVEAFAPQGADEAFRNCVRPRCSYRGADDADGGAGEYRVKGSGERCLGRGSGIGTGWRDR
jgi:hypothetical protein